MNTRNEKKKIRNFRSNRRPKKKREINRLKTSYN